MLRKPKISLVGFGLAFTVLLATVLSDGCSARAGGQRLLEADYSGDIVGDFVIAIEVGDLDKLSSLIESDPSLLELRDDVGQTPMHYAALGNQPKVLSLLKEKGLDPNERDFEGRTALTVLEDSGLRHDSTREVLIALGGTG